MNTKKITNYAIIILAVVSLFLVLFNVLTKDQGIMLFLGPIGLVLLVAALARPFVDWRNKKVRIKQKQIDYHKAIAQKEGKKPHTFSKKHTVWATSQKLANKIGNEKINPLAKANPRKTYYYISAACNNFNNN